MKTRNILLKVILNEGIWGPSESPGVAGAGSRTMVLQLETSSTTLLTSCATLERLFMPQIFCL